ncbi:MAG: hypothetical protein JWM26_961 [Betaproteobacteria bacterium]|nr:hypothetical protein [Betaproteobacteria bacterium]
MPRRNRSAYEFDDFRPYVPVEERRREAKALVEAQSKKKAPAWDPVEAAPGRAIANTFWGGSWCRNIESYSDFRSRLERGRSYLRSGAVVDLNIAAGVVKARVLGSHMYEVEVKIARVPKPRWDAVCTRCSGGIESVVDLLQGRLSQPVMAHMCSRESGLFPTPQEIAFDCTCPDWAQMCKHVAAVLYGIGARLDQRPQLLFALRGVDENELIARAGTGVRLGEGRTGSARRLAHPDLGALFGLDLAEAATQKKRGKSPSPARPRKARGR